MQRKPIISQRRERYRQKKFGYYSAPSALFVLVSEYIRGFIKPQLEVSLSLESKPTLLSSVDINNASSDDEVYLLLTMKCTRKELGNVTTNISAYLFNPEKNVNELTELTFEETPELMEEMDLVALKCISIQNFRGLVRHNSKIQIKINYDYMYRGFIKSALHQSYWRFRFNEGKLSLGELIQTNK